MQPLPPPPPRGAGMTARLSRNRLSGAVLAALLAPAVTFAQTQGAGSPADPQRAVDIDGVSVVGSRIKRAQIEGPAPITVISREQMDEEGFQTVADILQTLTQNTTTSFTGDLATGGFTPNAQVVNLRNMGPGYTLTLINGRRPPQYPQPYNRDNNVVNVASIPSAIVERVEILAGGASAIYGSDAVAGVVNIVLRENYDGNRVRVTTGTTHNGGGDSINLELSGGRSGNRWSALWALQYSERDPVFADQRHFLADSRNGPLGDRIAPRLSLIAIRGRASINGPVNRNAYYPGDAACEALGMQRSTTNARGTFCGDYQSYAARSISNKREFYSAYGHGTFDITPNTQLWASASYYTTKAISSNGTEFWSNAIDQFTQTRTGDNTNFYYDAGLGELVNLQRRIMPNELGGNQAASGIFDEYTYDVAAGVRGQVGRFDWDASASYGYYDYSRDRPRLLAKAIHDYFLGPQLGWSNSTGTGTGIYAIHELDLTRWSTPITPEVYESFATRTVNLGTTSSANVAFTINGDLFDLPAGPLGFAGVLEWNRQKTDLNSDPRTDQTRPLDEQTILNLTSSGETHGQRERTAIGMELRVPIVSQLSAQLAARRDQYDDISNVDAATTYNLGLEWRPFSNLLLRSTYATSFRAPDMQLIYAEGAASFSNVLDEYACRAGVGVGAGSGPRTRTACNVTGDPTIYQAQTLIAGNPELKEEEGTSWTAGFVWDIVDGMSLTSDWWRIRLEGGAIQFGNNTLLAQEASCRLGSTAGGNPPPDAARCEELYQLITRVDAPDTPDHLRIQRINNSYINSALRDSSGVDSNWRWRFTTERAGAFSINLSHSIILSNKRKQTEASTLIDYRDLSPGDGGSRNQRSRMRGSLTWSYRRWSTTLFGTRYGSNWSNAEVDGENSAGGSYGRRLAPYIRYNLTTGYQFSRATRVLLQVINLFDRQYRHDNSNTAYPFFDYRIGSDPLGRRYYLTVDHRF